MRRWNPASVLVWVAAWGAMMIGTAWGETIKGTVRATGAVPGEKRLTVTIDQYICGKEKVSEDLVSSPGKGIRNAVVSLQNPPVGAKWGTPIPSVKMDQKECVFVPRVVVVPVNGTVEFLNSDRLLHNLKSVSKENPVFNRAQPHGRTIPIVFRKPEIIRVDCDLHSWMRGWVVVADHPFFAVTNERGEFSLDNVPPGKYSLQVWQESLGTVTTEVAVEDKGISAVTIEMGKK